VTDRTQDPARILVTGGYVLYCRVPRAVLGEGVSGCYRRVKSSTSLEKSGAESALRWFLPG